MTTPVELHAARKAGAPTPQNTPAQNNPALSRPLVDRASGMEAVPEDKEPGAAAADVVNNPAFASLVQGRLDTLVGRSSGYIESLDPAIIQRVDGLQGIQSDLTKVVTEFQREIFELEKKYAEKYRPFYDQRRRIILGEEEPSKDLIERGQEQDEVSDEEEDHDGDEAEDSAATKKKPILSDTEIASAPKGIPEFWLTALKNHIGISELVTERDEELLKHLVDVRVAYFEKPGFKLIFKFGPGAAEWFTNENQVLEKTYYYQDEVGYEGDFIYDHSEGTEIQWVEGKDLTTRVEQKRQRNKTTNQTRVVKKVVPTDSFFVFFKPPSPQTEDDDQEDEDLDDRLELDYQIGEDLKDRVVFRAVDFFTGKALQREMLDEDNVDDDFDEDEDDEDADSAAAPDVATQPPVSVTPNSNQDPNECKQS